MKIWHPYTQHAIYPNMIAIQSAQGSFLHATSKSSKKETKYLDAISSWWVITHGHNHPKVRQAIQEASESLDQIIFAGFTHPYAEKVKQKLENILTDEDQQYLFFSDSGSTAVEVAIKLAIGYWYHQKGSSRDTIIALENSYHGDTHGAMSVGERGVFTRPYHQHLFPVERLTLTINGDEEQTIAHFSKILKENPNKIAALIIEPLILGAGGMVMYSPALINALADLCKKADVLLIVDEIMTGWGRCGKLFALDYCDVKPDIICYAKGLTGGFLPLAVTMTTEKIYAMYYSKDRSRTFFHSSSFTANPLACAAACANLDIWRSEDVLSRVHRIAHYHKKNKSRLAAHSRCLSVRQTGTILAFEVAVTTKKDYLSDIGIYLYDYFIKNGALIRPLGNTIYLMPPYCITEQELDFLYDLLLSALDDLAQLNL